MNNLEKIKSEPMRNNFRTTQLGGVDSSLLAKIAWDVLENNSSVLLDSETLPSCELMHAEELAKSLGLNYEVAKCTQKKNSCKIHPIGAAIVKSHPSSS